MVAHHSAKMYCSGRWPADGAALLAKFASAVILFILLKIMSFVVPFQYLAAWGEEATRHEYIAVHMRCIQTASVVSKNMCSYIHS